jgi:hypothetical protein
MWPAGGVNIKGAMKIQMPPNEKSWLQFKLKWATATVATMDLADELSTECDDPNTSQENEEEEEDKNGDGDGMDVEEDVTGTRKSSREVVKPQMDDYTGGSELSNEDSNDNTGDDVGRLLEGDDSGSQAALHRALRARSPAPNINLPDNNTEETQSMPLLPSMTMGDNGIIQDSGDGYIVSLEKDAEGRVHLASSGIKQPAQSKEGSSNQGSSKQPAQNKEGFRNQGSSKNKQPAQKSQQGKQPAAKERQGTHADKPAILTPRTAGPILTNGAVKDVVKTYSRASIPSSSQRFGPGLGKAGKVVMVNRASTSAAGIYSSSTVTEMSDKKYKSAVLTFIAQSTERQNKLMQDVQIMKADIRNLSARSATVSTTANPGDDVTPIVPIEMSLPVRNEDELVELEQELIHPGKVKFLVSTDYN